MTPELKYYPEPKPHIIIKRDDEPKGSRGFIWPEDANIYEVRFNTTVRQAAEQNSLKPQELISRLVAGESFNFDPSIKLIKG
ncbi:MAG: hypothetical protein UU12_C0029G0020 [Candidatus Woesebacteria bacterium GW2011_GWA2_40_7b]|uniref:Uncharacterized protein n=1 Tax=Candidatus Woesebacteria bacterium GW2011_GWA2_40_7b TaxID=1618563 RepID=A0A0G0SZE5_9BACT|nr:MAG: hypothetical protein UU12_C0029G0020 [Candidatus Woesebacteria bacterium GW2011_GWA2_40_7b]